MADPIYELLESPVYDTAIRAVQDSDPALASAIFTPLFTAMLNNTHFVKLMAEQVAAQLSGHVQDRQNPHGGTAEQVGAVPAGRMVNGKPLAADIALTAGDVGAAEAGHTHTAAQVGADPAGSAAGVQNSLNAFAARRDNPHGVTAAQVGALPLSGGTVTGIVRIDNGELDIMYGPGSGAYLKSVPGNYHSRLKVFAYEDDCLSRIGVETPFDDDDAANKAYVDKRAAYDVVIRTQAEFEALIASPTWLGAVSVCFVGDGGTLKFTRSDGQGIKIPQTVKQIQGLNSATIEVTKFHYNETTNKGALWYETLPTTDDYWIQGICVSCTSTRTSGIGFHTCTNLTNCIGIGNAGNYSGCDACGFYSCTQLTNCTGSCSGNINYSHLFYRCTQLVNCININSGRGFHECTHLTNCLSKSGLGFLSCAQLSNCTAVANDNSYSGTAFSSCTQLTNCTGTGIGTNSGNGFYMCTQLTNCTGTGIGPAMGYGFWGCSYINGCKQGETPSSIAFLGGTNTNVDNATVVAG